MLDEADLLRDCEMTFGRTGGPGGQHRNKVETACTITHTPSGITSGASERRQQGQNRSIAIFRLRVKLAVGLRRDVDRERYRPTELWKSRRQGSQISVNPKHADFPALLAEALDVIHARGCDVAGAAGILGVSMSQLAKLVRHNRFAFAAVNDGRTSRGLRALR